MCSVWQKNMRSLCKGVRLMQKDCLPRLHKVKGSLEAGEALFHEHMRLLLEKAHMVRA